MYEFSTSGKTNPPKTGSSTLKIKKFRQEIAYPLQPSFKSHC